MKRFLQRWRSDERGVSAVEFALLTPVLLTLLIGSVTVFDLFRTAQSAEKGTFTVGDMLSRETAITSAKLTSMLAFISNTVDHDGSPLLRVSSITNINGTLTVDWSRSVGNADIETDAVDMTEIPAMAAGDSIILTESFLPHRAFVPGFGLDHIVYANTSAQRPRFVGRIVFQ
jgi:Flp pilus assembly protein TadG